MKKEKIVRKLNKVTSFILGCIGVAIFIAVIIIPIIWVIIVGMSFFMKYTPDTIKIYKEEAYAIANEGLQSQRNYYDNWIVSSPDRGDKIQIIESGIKNLKYPDLMQVFLNDNGMFAKIEFSNNEFKIVIPYQCFYRELKITIDKRHIDDISYYEVSQKILWKKIFTHLIVLIIACLLIFAILGMLVDLLNKLEKNEQNTNSVDNAGKKKKKKRKKNKS